MGSADRELDCVPVNYGNVQVILDEGKQDALGGSQMVLSGRSSEKTSATSSHAGYGNVQLPGRRGKGNRAWRGGKRVRRPQRGGFVRRKVSEEVWTDSENEPLWPDHEGLGDEGRNRVNAHAHAHGYVCDDGDDGDDDDDDSGNGSSSLGLVDVLCRMAGKVDGGRRRMGGKEDGMGWWESAEEDGHDRVIKRRRLSKWDLHVARAGRSLTSSFRNTMSSMQMRRRRYGDASAEDVDDISLDVLQKLREKIHHEKPSESPPSQKRKRSTDKKSAANWNMGGELPVKYNDDSVVIYDNEGSEESQLYQAAEHNIRVADDGQAMNNWDSGHAVENFQVNTKGMKRCSEGYKNGQGEGVAHLCSRNGAEHASAIACAALGLNASLQFPGRLASFSKLGDIVDKTFRNQQKDVLFHQQKVPTKRIKADVKHEKTLCGPPNPGVRNTIRVIRQPKGMPPAEPARPQRRIVTPVKKPAMISGRVISGQRKEEQAPFRLVSKPMAPHQFHRNQFHSFLPRQDSVQERAPFSGRIYYRPQPYVPVQSRGSKISHNGSRRAARDDYQVFMCGDQRKNANASTPTRTPASTQRDIKFHDFMDILRRGGLTVASRTPNGIIPLVPQSQSFPLRAVDQHHLRPEYENFVEHRVHRTPVPPRVALCRAVQPVSQSINGQMSEKRVAHEPQRLFVKAPRQWGPGIKVGVERESVVMPVEVMLERGYVPLVDKS